MADLAVELYGTRAGVLRGTWRNFDFLPDPAAVAKFGIDSAVLSVAIPVAAVPVRSRGERRQNLLTGALEAHDGIRQPLGLRVGGRILGLFFLIRGGLRVLSCPASRLRRRTIARDRSLRTGGNRPPDRDPGYREYPGQR